MKKNGLVLGGLVMTFLLASMVLSPSSFGQKRPPAKKGSPTRSKGSGKSSTTSKQPAKTTSANKATGNTVNKGSGNKVNIDNSNKNVNINIDNSKDIDIKNNRNTVVKHNNINSYRRPPYYWGGHRYYCYHPYRYHPYRPFYWGPVWHPWGFFVATLATTAIIVSVNNAQYHYDQGVWYAPIMEDIL